MEEELKESQRIIYVLKDSHSKGEKLASGLIYDLKGKVKDLQISSKEKSANLASVKGCLEDSFVPITVFLT